MDAPKQTLAQMMAVRAGLTGQGPATNPLSALAAQAPVSMEQAQAEIARAEILAALKTAPYYEGRNDMPLGKAWYLLKSGKYSISPTKGYQITSFQMLCINPLSDADGLPPTSPNYTGPRKWEEYELAFFHETNQMYVKGKTAQKRSMLAACRCWTKEMTQRMTSTQKGMDAMELYLSGMFSRDLLKRATGLPCMFSNQVVVQITTKMTVPKAKMDEKTGKPLMAGDQPVMTKSQLNDYWDGGIPLDVVNSTLGDEETVKAFGSQEAFMTAFQTQIDSMTADAALMAG
jgi:hypothetical protein